MALSLTLSPFHPVPMSYGMRASSATLFSCDHECCRYSSMAFSHRPIFHKVRAVSESLDFCICCTITSSISRSSFTYQRGCSLPRKRKTPSLSSSCLSELPAVAGSSGDEEIESAKETEKVAQEAQADDDGGGRGGGIGAYASRAIAAQEYLPPEGLVVFLSCAVGLMTGLGVVLFNVGVHELHDIVWQGVPQGTDASWFRTQEIQTHWVQVLTVPAGGGVIVGLLNLLRSSLSELGAYRDKGNSKPGFNWKSILEPLVKTVAAVVTLGTGNSLGPEGPSVEIGASIGKGLGLGLKNSRERVLSLIAAGSAAGISSGFNAAVSGCFFAVESVLRPLSSDSAPSLTTAMVLLSAVIASVISQAGLGSDPAFKTPAYDFRSPAELPLYLLLGIFCGLVSVGLTKCTSFSSSMFQKLKAVTCIPDAFLPPMGGLCVGLIALAYPEILYFGFENVNILLESRPFQRGPPAMLLLQLVGVKIVATSICRGSGLVGGYYAPSLFIGAALGSAYGKLAGYVVAHADPMYHLDSLKVAIPQAYALVGMAATLAGVCQVPLTSVLLLFELTRDYRIIIPLMAAVGVSSSVASMSAKKPQRDKTSQEKAILSGMLPTDRSATESISETGVSEKDSDKLAAFRDGARSANSNGPASDDLCSVENSLCMANQGFDEESLISVITVAAAMRTCYIAIAPTVTVHDALELMLAHKEWCVLLVRDGNILEGIVTMSDIQQHAQRMTKNGKLKVTDLTVAAICNSWVHGGNGFPVVTAYPDMSLKAARRLMTGRGLRQLPVVSRELYLNGKVKVLEGLIDRDCIMLTCRAEATRRMLRMPVQSDA